MIELIDDLPTDTIGFRASGTVSADDYRRVVEPALAGARDDGAPVNMVYVIGDDVDRFSLGAMAQDAKVGTTPEKDWGRIAVVTDHHWIVGAVHLFRHFYRCEVRTFDLAQEATATAWAADTAAA